MWGNGDSDSLLMRMQNATDTLKIVCQFLTKLNIFLAYNLAIVLLCIYLKLFKIYVSTKVKQYPTGAKLFVQNIKKLLGLSFDL